LVLAALLVVNAGLYFASFTVLTAKTIGPRGLLPGAVAGAVAFTVLITAGTGLITHQLKNASATYGAFGSITRDRYEIVIEGTTHEEITGDAEWRTYEFGGKPTNTGNRPRQIAPYHLRLDWQLWFAAMSPTPYRSPWFLRLLVRLLEGDEATLELLADVPFEEPPTYVRAVRYRYRYTTPEEREESGRWWKRERVGSYVDPVSLDEVRDRRVGRRRGLP
ncbi:MAG: lipase maturation factor family protein, partial [Halalkalicoccus sp.]